MLRGTRDNISSLGLRSYCAGVIALCFLLLVSAVVVLPQGNPYSALSPSAFAQQQTEDGETGPGEEQVSETEALANLQRIAELAEIINLEGLEEIAGASDSEELANIAGASDSEELAATPGITDSVAIEAIANVPDLEGLAELVGVALEQLPRVVIPQPNPTTEDPTTEDPINEDPINEDPINEDPTTEDPTTEDPTTEDPTTEDPTTEDPTTEDPTTNPLTAEIISNATEGVAPATFEFEATIADGTEPYTISWDFGDGSEESDEQNVVHTFDEAGTYNVTLSVTDSEDQTATDSIEITVEGAATEDPTTEDPTTNPLTAEIISNATEGVAPATFEFEATIADGTEPYTISWDFGDGSEESDEQNVVHTFDEAGTYNVTLSVTDSEDQTATDSIEITVEGAATEEPVPPGNGGIDRFGVDEIYPTASSGPTWYIREQQDPTADGYFYYGMYRTTTIEYSGNGVWQVDARSGTQEHGIRMHVDSPNGVWKNTEITGYFKVLTGNDQITMIARHGPSYHDNGGCEAYGYYGMTAVDGNVFFKKKLYHFNDGYTKRLAQVDALENISDEWIGMKFVVYDLANGDVKLELWIDDGDMTNNWRKVTELVDEGNLAVVGGDDCSRQSTDKIEDGTRVSYRADNSMFDFKKLSVREIEP